MTQPETCPCRAQASPNPDVHDAGALRRAIDRRSAVCRCSCVSHAGGVQDEQYCIRTQVQGRNCRRFPGEWPPESKRGGLQYGSQEQERQTM